MEADGLVLSLIRQGNEPGEVGTTQLLWEVPEGWATEVLTLTPGQQIPLDVTVITIDEGVSDSVSGTAELVGDCVRCLAPVRVEQSFSATEVFVHPELADQLVRGMDPDIDVQGDELDPTLVINRNSVDLEPLLRDAILAEAELTPTCGEDCLGICVHCGILLKDAPPDHKHEFLDPRFAALAGFFDRDDSDESEKSESQDG